MGRIQTRRFSTKLEKAAATLPPFSIVEVSIGAEPTPLFEEPHGFAVEVQYVFVDEPQRVTHVRLVLEVCFVLREQVDVFSDTMICFQKGIESFVECGGHLV